MPEVRRLLVVLPNWIGDVVMATPALRALRERFADAHITFIGKAGSVAVLAGTAWADALLEDLSTSGPPADLFRMAATLRRRRYDLAVLLPNSFRSALLVRLGSVPRAAGYDRDGRGWMLTHRLAVPTDERGRKRVYPALDYYIDLAESLGAEVTCRRMELPTDAESERAAEALLREAGVDRARPVVMLNPGGAFGPSKMWAPRRYAALADALVDRRGAQIIINAAPNEREIAAEVGEEMTGEPTINFAERDNTLGLLKSLLSRCDLLVTNDTGARHIGAAMGAAIVTVFGSTDPAWTTIDYDRERLVISDVPCAPCQRKLCALPPGPFYHRCMNAIPPERVIAAAEELLQAAGARA